MSFSIVDKLGLNKSLALLVLTLAVISLAGTPYPGNRMTIDGAALARIVENEVDHVTVQDLADRIIKGTTEYRLLDIRDAAAYAEYHIPTAENVPMHDLMDYPLLHNEEIIVYSGGGIHSAQAWFLLKAKKYKGVYMLLGGLSTWKDQVLFPALPENATPAQIAEFEKEKEVSTFFGGSPRTAAAGSVEEPDMKMPVVIAPSQPVIRTRKKKAKEGC